MPRDVFISYQHNDLATAKEVCGTLEAANISCWISERDARPGENWMAALVKGLNESKIVVFVLSANSDKSDAYKNELALAHDRHIPIIPLRVDSITPTGDLEYLLARIQRLDALSRPIGEHLKALVEAVRSLLASFPDEGSSVQIVKEAVIESKQHLDDLRAFQAEQCRHLDIVVYTPAYGPCSQCISRHEGFREFLDKNQPYVSLSAQTYPGTWGEKTMRVRMIVRETGVIQDFDANANQSQMVAWATKAIGCPGAVYALPAGYS